MKVKNRLLNYDMIIYQNDDWFKFSLDSVLLANFVSINLRCKKIIDLASGNAPIPMLLSNRTKAHIDGIELQNCIYKLGVESIKENNLSNQISLVCGDVREIDKYFDSESYDVVICNPPYFKTNSDGYFNDNDIKRVARHEVMLSLEDVVKSAKYLLRNGGNLAMVHTTSRFIEVINCLKEYNFEPKRIQFIYPKEGSNSDLFMVEASKNGKSNVKILPGLVIHNDDGSYRDNISEMLNKERWYYVAKKLWW